MVLRVVTMDRVSIIIKLYFNILGTLLGWRRRTGVGNGFKHNFSVAIADSGRYILLHSL